MCKDAEKSVLSSGKLCEMMSTHNEVYSWIEWPDKDQDRGEEIST